MEQAWKQKPGFLDSDTGLFELSFQITQISQISSKNCREYYDFCSVYCVWFAGVSCPKMQEKY